MKPLLGHCIFSGNVACASPEHGTTCTTQAAAPTCIPEVRARSNSAGWGVAGHGAWGLESKPLDCAAAETSREGCRVGGEGFSGKGVEIIYPRGGSSYRLLVVLAGLGFRF